MNVCSLCLNYITQECFLNDLTVYECKEQGCTGFCLALNCFTDENDCCVYFNEVNDI